MRPVILGLCVWSAVGVAGPASAWGDLGHEVAALIAYDHLTPKARTRVDALLAADKDTLTGSGFADRAVWADRYRAYNRATAPWHVIALDLDSPSLPAACAGPKKLASGQAASAGPSQDCVVDKIDQFAAELRDPATPEPERILALKYLIHFTGDLEQPLHASDDHDRNGECIGLVPPAHHATNLHAYWDEGAVEALGGDARAIAARLKRDITPAKVKAWSAGTPGDWAMDSYGVARDVAYQIPSLPDCEAHATITLSRAYQAHAQSATAVQLEKAGVRIAAELNASLG
jgi:hypothetical protein